MRVMRDLDAHSVAFEALRGHHQAAWQHLVGQRLAIAAVEVRQEAVESGHPLAQDPGQFVPLGRGDQAREEVHRPNPFGVRILAVDGEGDALTTELFGDELFEAP